MYKKTLINTAAVVLLLSAAATTAPTAYADNIHTVTKGETLYSISRAYNVPVATIKSLNALKSDTIFLGQKIVVSKSNTVSNSSGSSASKTYKVKSGDTLWKIASSNNLTVAKLMELNKLTNGTIKVGQALILNQSSNSSTSSTNTTTTKPTTSTSSAVKSTGVVTASVLNVRSSASTTGKIVGTLKNNSSVDIIETLGGWYKIKSGSTTGYVSASYIKLSVSNSSNSTSKVANNISSSTTATSAATYKGTVTASALNLRSSASTSASILTAIPKNKEIVILSESGSWFKVTYGSKTGWVSKDYVKKGAAITSTSSTSTASTSTSTTNLKYVVSSNGGLNLRSSASTSSKVLTVIPNNAIVSVLELGSSWHKVKYNNLVGYVSSVYVGPQTSTSSTKPNTSDFTYKASNNKRTVVLDPGHGGVDPGAVNGSYKEANYVITVAQNTKAFLEALGYNVILTRTNSSCTVPYVLNPDLQCRVQVSNTRNADAFVSIHINSAVPGAIGTESYYTLSNSTVAASKKLAQDIHSEYQPVFGSKDRGLATANYYVLKYNKVPSTLLELGFISDSRDLARLNNSTTMLNVSKAIARGINDYFN